MIFSAMCVDHVVHKTQGYGAVLHVDWENFCTPLLQTHSNFLRDVEYTLQILTSIYTYVCDGDAIIFDNMLGYVYLCISIVESLTWYAVGCVIWIPTILKRCMQLNAGSECPQFWNYKTSCYAELCNTLFSLVLEFVVFSNGMYVNCAIQLNGDAACNLC